MSQHSGREKGRPKKLGLRPYSLLLTAGLYVEVTLGKVKLLVVYFVSEP